MKSLRLLITLLFLWPLAAFAHPAESYQFHSREAEMRAMELSRELRCPQCQNQNLMESNSPIAMDLRLEVYKMVDQGVTDDQVVVRMTSRFGEFVRYRPSLSAGTLLLWGTPAFLILLAVAWLLYARFRARPETLIEAHPAPAAVEKALPQSGTQMWIVPGIVALVVLAVLGGYATTGRWQEAITWRNKPDPLLNLDSEGLKNAAQQNIEKRLQANPRDIDAWSELAQLYSYREDLSPALKIYDRIAELEGEMSASTAAAKATVLYYQAGQVLTPEARKLTDQALALDTGEVTALMLLASDHFLNARYNEAIALWQQLLNDGRPRINREQLIRAIQMAQQMAG